MCKDEKMSDIYDTESDVFIPITVKFPVELVDAAYCIWTQRRINSCVYNTSCDNEHILAYGILSTSGFNFCPYCGKPIKDVPFA